MTVSGNSWKSHDFTVKMLDWSAARGSRLLSRCRRCGRNFHHFSAANQGIWAVDEAGRTLERIVSDRWLAEECPRLFSLKDDEDRKRLSKPDAA
jgi:hypothetical protein